MRQQRYECDHYVPLLDAYLDGELKGRTARRLEAHIAVCPACAAALEECRELRALLAACDDTLVPTQEEIEHLHQSVMASVREQPRVATTARPARWAGRRTAGALAACVVLLAILVPVVLLGDFIGDGVATSPDAPSMEEPGRDEYNGSGGPSGGDAPGDSAGNDDAADPGASNDPTEEQPSEGYVLTRVVAEGEDGGSADGLVGIWESDGLYMELYGAEDVSLRFWESGEECYGSIRDEDGRMVLECSDGQIFELQWKGGEELWLIPMS